MAVCMVLDLVGALQARRSTGLCDIFGSRKDLLGTRLTWHGAGSCRSPAVSMWHWILWNPWVRKGSCGCPKVQEGAGEYAPVS
eukprot:29677-Pelagomonas_calceolata.AAC.1